MVDGELFLETLTGFARTLAHGYAISDVLHDLTVNMTAVLDTAGAGVSLVQDDGKVAFATADHEAIASIERVQQAEQDGPCHEAVISGEIVAVSDLRTQRARWPAYVEQAANAGIAAAAGVPMGFDGGILGAINLYDDKVRDWTSEDLRVARVLADIATSYIVNASTLDQQRRTTEQLREALESRIIIEQAKGVLANDRNISVDEAFNQLRKHARGHNANLHDVAHAVVHLGLRP